MLPAETTRVLGSIHSFTARPTIAPAAGLMGCVSHGIVLGQASLALAPERSVPRSGKTLQACVLPLRCPKMISCLPTSRLSTLRVDRWSHKAGKHTPSLISMGSPHLRGSPVRLTSATYEEQSQAPQGLLNQSGQGSRTPEF